MAKLRFQLGGWTWGYRINSSQTGTGFLCVEEDNSVCVKTLFKTTFLFKLSQVKAAEQNAKEMKVTASDGTLIELKAKTENLSELGRLINAESGSTKAA